MYFKRISRRREWGTIAGGYNVLVGLLRLGYQLSEDRTKRFLSALQPMLFSIGRRDAAAMESLKGLYLQPSTALKYLDIDPFLVTYACCPKCKAVYKKRSDGTYPDTCTKRPAPDDPQCDQPLLGRRREKIKRTTANDVQLDEYIPSVLPREIFVFQPLHHWLAELMSRPGMETIIDQTWYRMNNRSPDTLEDIIHGSTIRNFKGHDKRPFFKAPGGEGRYMIATNIDGFNPIRTRAAGKQYSVQGIYGVLLDLPEHLRYLPENVYHAGLMPGPKKPSLDQMNYMMEPLVDDLEISYKEGVFITRTHNYPKGRVVRCVLGPVVADMPGGRQMAGFAFSTAKQGCTCCDAEWRHNVDFASWSPRSSKTFRKFAEQWRACRTTKARQNHFKLHQVRWSVLLRLTYWNPIKMLCPDPMHIWYLGAFQTLCRHLWGMDVTLEDGDRNMRAMPKEVSQDEVPRARAILMSGSNRAVRQLTWEVMKVLCTEHSIQPSPQKASTAQSLLDLVSLSYLDYYFSTLR